jgi:glycosyltransferase involved in cell wall biosynthesis
VQILCFASADFEEHNWVNAQHLMSRLSTRHAVLYVNSLGLRRPHATRRDARKILRRLRAFASGPRRPDRNRQLYVLSPLLLPPRAGRRWRRAAAGLLTLQLRAALRRVGFRRPLAWVFLPTASDVLAALPLGPIVYHCVDAYASNPGVDGPLIDALERELLARAACVVASSRPLRDRLSAQHARVILMPNVADLAAYPPPGAGLPEPREIASLPHPRIGYLGNLASYKCDLALLERAARRRGDCSWIFVGAIGQGEPGTPPLPLSRHANVHMLGEQPRERLAAFLHHLDVALIPFADNETTRNSFPMKFFEYLACGLPVVTRALPGLSEFLDPPHAYPYTNDEEFFAALEQALSSRAPGQRQARRALAEAHSWDARLEEVESLLRELADR